MITNELDLANNLFRDFGNGADLSAKIITDLNYHGTKILTNTINEIMALKNENI